MSRMATAGLISLMGVTALLSGCSTFGTPQLRTGSNFADCDEGPHCVSSQATDPAKRVDAIQYNGTRAGAQQLMVSILTVMPGAKLLKQEDGYLHATFTSPTMSFVDDLELQFPSQKFIDVRSSSRIGYYDFGTNRNRVEALRKAFNERQP